MKESEDTQMHVPPMPDTPHTHTTTSDEDLKSKIIATYESTAAPDWLVMPNHIINAQNVLWLRKRENTVFVKFKDGYELNIPTSDLNQTWTTLQHAFADGVKKR